MITGGDNVSPNQLNVFSDNDGDIGDYSITVAFTVINSLGDEFMEDINFNLIVGGNKNCAGDFLTIVSQPQAITEYYLNFLQPTIGDGTVEFTFVVEQEIDCPVTFELPQGLDSGFDSAIS